MLPRRSYRSRLPIAAAAIAAVVASSVTADVAHAAPTKPSPHGSTGGIAVTHKDLRSHLAGQQVLPRSAARALPGAGEPGGVNRPAGVPSHGSYAFLLQLNNASTLSAYRQARAQGKAAASAAARAQFSRIKSAQAAVIAALPRGTRVLYRTHSVVSGVGVVADVRNFGALRAIAGVHAVLPIAPKTVSNSYAIGRQRGSNAWAAHSDRGENTTIAVIDTGIDFTHANFGGPGTASAYNTAIAHDNVAADPSLFPSAKIIGGFDFAGDDYNADPSSPAFQPVPHPDANPLDCEGHGSHVAGTAAGLGVTAAGLPYGGPYDLTTPFNTLRIGPGMAPGAKLLAYKVFGCAGSTDVVGAAIDMAADPNGDGDPADHASVINMSLGSDYGSPQDADSVASNAASELGITVVVASGNGGDFYDVGGSPGNAVRTIAVANSVDAYSQLDALHVSAPAAIAGDYGSSRSVAYDWAGLPHGDLAGTVVRLSSPGNLDGCDALSPADTLAVAGKIAFLEWTDDSSVRRCGSVKRSGNVAKAGAIGFIFGDDRPSFSAGITGSTAIPGVIVVKSASDAIRGELLAAHTVTVSGTTANSFASFVNAEDETLNESSSRGVRGAGNVKPDVTAIGTTVFSTAVGTGSEGISESGTSMATPMVAGLSALVRSLHPDWTPEEVKADIMNTAGQDVFTGNSHTGDAYAPNRVGAGRIVADSALDNLVLAYVHDDPGAVSASFGSPAVTAPVTLTKTIDVVNKDLAAASYAVSYDALTSIPGVSYTVSPSSVTVGARSTAKVTLTLTISDPTKLTKTIDPTMAASQTGLPREFLADASGRLVFAAVGGTRPDLRVPVYSAPRPASVMTQASSLTLPYGAVQTTALNLSGQRVHQGSGPALVQSTMAGFELQAISPAAPACSPTLLSGCVHFPDERAADLKYVATTSDAPQLTSVGQDPFKDGMVYFSVTTQGPWRTAASAHEFDVLIDTDGDSKPDVMAFNTRLAGQDIFVAELVDLKTFDVLDLEPINGRLGDTDTALFDSDTMVLPVWLGALPNVSATNTRIHYGIESFGPVVPDPVDQIGLSADGTKLENPLSLDVVHPGVAVFGSYDGPPTSPVLFPDSPGSVLVLRRDRGAYGADGGLGALIVHFHNGVGTKAQRVALMSASTVKVRLTTTRARLRQKVWATITVTNTAGPVATGQVVLRYTGPGRKSYRLVLTLRNGQATFRIPTTRRGDYGFRAYYGGDANYLRGVSPLAVLRVR